MSEWFLEDVKQESKFPPAFRPAEGKTLVKILGEPEKVQLPDYQNKEQQVTKAIFPIEVAGQRLAWFVTWTHITTANGKYNGSLYAQLGKLARQNGGLTGKTIELNCLGEGKSRRYMVNLYGV